MFELNWHSIPVWRGVSYIIVVYDGAKILNEEVHALQSIDKICWGGKGGGGFS